MSNCRSVIGFRTSSTRWSAGAFWLTHERWCCSTGRPAARPEGCGLTVSGVKAQVIASPVKGDGWLTTNACCTPSPHRGGRVAVGGTHPVKFEMFAVDWVRVQDGAIGSGDGTAISDYPDYGADLLAVANGTMVATHDGLPAQVPEAASTGLKTAQDYAGNSVVLKIAPHRYATYAHLVQRSLKVKMGDRVRNRDVIGELGNSGNTSGPHLHFCDPGQPGLLHGDEHLVRHRQVDAVGHGHVGRPAPGAPSDRACPGAARHLPARRRCGRLRRLTTHLPTPSGPQEPNVFTLRGRDANSATAWLVQPRHVQVIAMLTAL